jgi:2-polyprenyl-3-methyl-5-hydroxy-6-metoxy-1,4-benzoquinol methylase
MSLWYKDVDMSLQAARLNAERCFHDQQATERADTFLAEPSAFHDLEKDYLDHETWIRPAFARLGNLQDKDVLDYGCGHGMASVVMARQGARVTAFDLSSGYLREARQRALANHVAVRFVQVNGEQLPFPDHSFDRIWGNAVLHHVDLDLAGRELKRVLRPDGIAVFCEPWGENYILNWVRRSVAYPGKQRTADERPLAHRDLAVLRNIFTKVDWKGYQLFSMVRRVMRPSSFVRALDRCDDWLLCRISLLQRFCRYMVLTLHR